MGHNPLDQERNTRQGKAEKENDEEEKKEKVLVWEAV